MNIESTGTSGQAAAIIGINLGAFRARWQRGTLPFSPVGSAGGYHLWNLEEVKRYAELERANRADHLARTSNWS